MKDKKEWLRAAKYLLLSVSAGLIQAVTYKLLDEVAKIDNYWACYLPALILSILWNFTLNRKITFQSANNVPIAMLKVAGFYAVFTPLSTVGGNELVKAGWNSDLVFVLTMLLNFVLEFLFFKFVVFRGSIDSAVKEQ